MLHDCILLTQQAEEISGLVEEEHFNWVAQYLVMKRASIEPNFHGLYSGFLDVYSSLTLHQGVLQETYRNIKVSLVSIGRLVLYKKFDVLVPNICICIRKNCTKKMYMRVPVANINVLLYHLSNYHLEL